MRNLVLPLALFLASANINFAQAKESVNVRVMLKPYENEASDDAEMQLKEAVVSGETSLYSPNDMASFINIPTEESESL